jgi:hypothetical protein
VLRVEPVLDVGQGLDGHDKLAVLVHVPSSASEDFPGLLRHPPVVIHRCH